LEDRYRTHTAGVTGEHGIKEYQQVEELLKFLTATRNYCVGIVDMVGSTGITMKMGPEKASRLYGIFLNGLAEVLSRHGAVVVKNVGDSLLYYFPETEDGDAESFRQVMRCCFAMVDAGPALNAKMAAEGLPEVSYRTSCEYGSVMVARMSTSSVNDIFGMPVNLCSKMNPLAQPGGVVIGEGLYEKVKGFGEYDFAEIRGTSLVADNSYSVYSVKRH
jgi:adenylate cyclase